MNLFVFTESYEKNEFSKFCLFYFIPGDLILHSAEKRVKSLRNVADLKIQVQIVISMVSANLDGKYQPLLNICESNPKFMCTQFEMEASQKTNKNLPCDSKIC